MIKILHCDHDNLKEKEGDEDEEEVMTTGKISFIPCFFHLVMMLRGIWQ